MKDFKGCQWSVAGVIVCVCVCRGGVVLEESGEY